jgi:hypothetical protein
MIAKVLMTSRTICEPLEMLENLEGKRGQLQIQRANDHGNESVGGQQ